MGQLIYNVHDALNQAQLDLSGLAIEAVSTLKKLLLTAKTEQTKLRAAIFIIERLELTSGLVDRNEPNINNPISVDMNLLTTALGGKS